MPRVRVHQQYHNLCDFYKDKIIAYQNVDSTYREIFHLVESAAKTLMPIHIGCGMMKTEENEEDQPVKLDLSQNVRIGA